MRKRSASHWVSCSFLGLLKFHLQPLQPRAFSRVGHSLDGIMVVPDYLFVLRSRCCWYLLWGTSPTAVLQAEGPRPFLHWLSGCRDDGACGAGQERRRVNTSYWFSTDVEQPLEDGYPSLLILQWDPGAFPGDVHIKKSLVGFPPFSAYFLPRFLTLPPRLTFLNAS